MFCNSYITHRNNIKEDNGLSCWQGHQAAQADSHRTQSAVLAGAVCATGHDHGVAQRHRSAADGHVDHDERPARGNRAVGTEGEGRRQGASVAVVGASRNY